MKLVPLEAVEAILFMIESGELPEPGPGEAMDEWLEQCRQAGSGEFRLTLGQVPASVSEPGQETEADLARLARIKAEAEAKPAGGATTPAKR